jgi:hypothetical protein
MVIAAQIASTTPKKKNSPAMKSVIMIMTKVR